MKHEGKPANSLQPYTIASSRVIRFVAFALSLLVFPGAVRAKIEYHISLAQPATHLIQVTMKIPGVHESVLVQMPAWNATYQIRDFASHVQNLRATDESKHPVSVSKLDKQTWRVIGDGTVTISYVTFWDESSPFSSQLNSAHAFLNLAEVLVYVPERRKEDVSLGISFSSPSWRLAAAERDQGVERFGLSQLWTLGAPNYDALVDAPVEIGDFQSFDLPNITPPVHVVVHSDNWNKTDLSEGLSRIVRFETALMGGAPYESYTFIFHIGANSYGGGGGMEHANSTAIGSASTAGAIATAAHEFFHLWNVKRIRPQSLEPVDYTKEMYTRALWFAEGVTSTYGAYTEVRTGMWTPRQFYEDLADQIGELQSRPAYLWQSVEESSLNAWLEKYPQYNRPEYSISYYNKGQLVGVLLDVLIRDATDNHRSLDDVLRSLNDNFAKQGRFYNDSADIEATVETVSGTSFRDFFANFVAGTDEVPFADVLAKAGLNVTTVQTVHPALGFETSAGFAANQVIISSVLDGGPAQQAGVHTGDVVLSLNGDSIARGGLERWLQSHRPGEIIKVRVRRQTEEKELLLTIGSETAQEFRVQELKNASEKQRRIREGLLKGKTN